MIGPNQQASDWYLSIDNDPLLERIQTPTGWKIVDGLEEHLIDKDDPEIPASWKHITKPDRPYLTSPKIQDKSGIWKRYNPFVSKHHTVTRDDSRRPWTGVLFEPDLIDKLPFSSAKDILEQATSEPSNLERSSGEYREPTGYGFDQLKEDWSGSYLGKKGTSLWEHIKKIPSAFARIGTFGTELDSKFQERFGVSPGIGDVSVEPELGDIGDAIESVGDWAVSGVGWDGVEEKKERPDYSYQRAWMRGGPASLFSKAGTGVNTSGYEYLIGYIKESHKLEQDLINQKDLLKKSGIDPMTDQDFSYTKEKLDGLYNKIHTMSDNIKKWRQGYSLSIYNYINIESDRIRNELAHLGLEKEPKPSIHKVEDPVEKIDIINKDNQDTIENNLAKDVIENTGSIPKGAYDAYYFEPLNQQKYKEIKEPIDEIRKSQNRFFNIKNEISTMANKTYSEGLYRQTDPYIIGSTKQLVQMLVKAPDLSSQEQGILLKDIISNLDIITTRLDSSTQRSTEWGTENSTEELLKFAFRDIGSNSTEIMASLMNMIDDINTSLIVLHEERADPVRSLENFALDMMRENVNHELKSIEDMNAYVGGLMAQGSKTGQYTHGEVVRGLEIYNSVMKNAKQFMGKKSVNAGIESDMTEFLHFQRVLNDDGNIGPVKNSVSPNNYLIRDKNHRANPDEARDLLEGQRYIVTQDFAKDFRHYTRNIPAFSELSEEEMMGLANNAVGNIFIDNAPNGTGELNTRSLFIPHYGTALILSTAKRRKDWAPAEGMHPALEVMGKTLMDVVISVGGRKGETIENAITQRDLHNRYYSSLYSINELINAAGDASTGVSHNVVMNMLGLTEQSYIALQGWLGTLEANEFNAQGLKTGSSMLSTWATFALKELYDNKTGEVISPNLEEMDERELAIYETLYSPELLAEVFGDTRNSDINRDNFIAIATEQYDSSNFTDEAKQRLESLPDLPKTLIEANMKYIDATSEEFSEEKYINDMRPYHRWLDLMDPNSLINFMENNRHLIDQGQYQEYMSMATQYPELVQLSILDDWGRQTGNELMMQHIIGSYASQNKGDLIPFGSLLKIVTSAPANSGIKLINGRPIPNDYVQVMLDHSGGATRRDNLTGEGGYFSTNFGNATAAVDNDIGFWSRLYNLSTTVAPENRPWSFGDSRIETVNIPDSLKPIIRERVQFTKDGVTLYNNFNYGKHSGQESLAIGEQLVNNLTGMAHNASTIQFNTGFESLDSIGNLGTAGVLEDLFMLMQEQQLDDPSGQLNDALVGKFSNKDMIGNAFFDWVMVNSETRTVDGQVQLYSPILDEIGWGIEDLFPIPVTVALEDNKEIIRIQKEINAHEEKHRDDTSWDIAMYGAFEPTLYLAETQTYRTNKRKLKALTSKEALMNRYVGTGKTDWKYADEDLYVFPFIDFKVEWDTITDPVTNQRKDVLMMFIGGKEVPGPNGIPTRKWLKLGTAPGGDKYKTPIQGTVSEKFKRNRTGHNMWTGERPVKTKYDLGKDWADPQQQIHRSYFPASQFGGEGHAEAFVKDIPASPEALAVEYVRDQQWIDDMRDSELQRVRSNERWATLNKRQKQEIEGDILRQANLDRRHSLSSFSRMMDSMDWTLPDGYIEDLIREKEMINAEN